MINDKFLKKQEYVRTDVSPEEVYNVFEVIKLAEPLEIVELGVDELYSRLADFKVGDGLSIGEVVSNIDAHPDHKERVMNASLSFPIIIAPNWEIIDGNHRLVKAKIQGLTTIRAKVISDWSVIASCRKVTSISSFKDVLTILSKPKLEAKDILLFRNVIPTKQEDGTYSIEKSRWNYSTKITLNVGHLANVTGLTETTVGRAVANKLFKVDPFGSFYPYTNDAMDINDFIDMCTVDLMNGKVTPQQMSTLFNNVVWITRFADMILPSFSEKVLITPKKSRELRKQLEVQYKDMADNSDIRYLEKVENPVLASTIGEIKDDPSYVLYTKGKPSPKNHLKQCIVNFSPIIDLTTGKYKFPKNNLQEGISPDDYYLFANMNISGTYKRSVQTQDGGSIVKSIYNSMNTIMIAPEGSDCGSNRTKKILLTGEKKKSYMWNYMVEGDRLILLTPDNVASYVGKMCEFRSPLYCKNDNVNQICNKCAGEIPYRTKLKSIGSLTSRVGFNFVNASLKVFHDSTVQLVDLNPFEFMSVSSVPKK